MSRFLRTFEANPPKRHGKMDKQIELSQTEIELAFASFCIEGTRTQIGAALPRGVRTHETGRNDRELYPTQL